MKKRNLCLFFFRPGRQMMFVLTSSTFHILHCFFSFSLFFFLSFFVNEDFGRTCPDELSAFFLSHCIPIFVFLSLFFFSFPPFFLSLLLFNDDPVGKCLVGFSAFFLLTLVRSFFFSLFFFLSFFLSLFLYQ